MAHSTVRIPEHQYLRAFRTLFPTRLLRRAVAIRRRATRRRQLPLHVLLGMLLTWFFEPDAGLPKFITWFLRSGRPSPSEAAVYQARRRLGGAPLRWLRRRVLRPLARRDLDRDAYYQGWHLLALDGSTLTVADSPANARCFGRARNQHGAAGYPSARIVALCEVGTHALLDWVVRGYRRSEVDLARRLLRRVPAGSLLLLDREFHSYELWRQAQRGGFELLLRVQKGPRFPALAVLPDGSSLSAVLPRRGPDRRGRALTVRVICYAWADGEGRRHEARLLTSLLDAKAHPAAELVELYHRRWEQEAVFKEVKGQLARRPTHLRAQEPRRVLQEVDALLMGHFLVRWVLLQAARKAGVPAVRLSYPDALRVLRVRLARIPPRPPQAKRWWPRWWEELLRALARHRVRPRTGRRCPRVRKVTRSRWPLKKGQKEGTIPEREVVPSAAGSSP
jgi:hypothetical protein